MQASSMTWPYPVMILGTKLYLDQSLFFTVAMMVSNQLQGVINKVPSYRIMIEYNEF